MYEPLLFVHAFSAIALMGPAYLLPLVARMRGTPPSVAVLRVEALINRYVGIFAVVALLSGGWLIGESPLLEDRFGDARWLHVGMTLFFVMVGVGHGFALPRTRKALAAAERGEGEQAARLLGPVDRIAGPVLGVLGAVIVYLMVIKPDL
ncbi:MAG: DUF2269 family protein [Acidimicrobiia bacterium]